jgi:1,3-beta-glucan synthase
MSYGGPQSQEGLYSRNSPPSDGHDILAAGSDQYYTEEDYEPRTRRRDTIASDGSDGPEGERYYDHNGPYDPYGMSSSDPPSIWAWCSDTWNSPSGHR